MWAVTAVGFIIPPVILAAPGDLDPSFGTGGLVTTFFSSDGARAKAIAIQPDGRIVAAGWVKTGATYDLAIARYNPNGNLDESFGTAGLTTTDLGSDEDFVNALAMQVDGKIVVAGATLVGGSGDYAFAIARYNSDGSLDPGFGSAGIVIVNLTSSSEQANAVAIQNDGRILVVGQSDFVLIRLETDGSLDTTFGTDGVVNTSFTTDNDRAQAALIQPDGKIVAIGNAGFGSGDTDFAVARYDSNGNLDTTFGTAGQVTSDFGSLDENGLDVAILPTGQLLLAGATLTDTGFDFALIKYNSDGTLDTSFGTAGLVTTDFAGENDLGLGVVIQGDGRIVISGAEAAAFPSGTADFAIVRYDSDGTLDNTFGVGGRITTDFSGNDDFGFGLALQDDGRILVAGDADLSGIQHFALARYLRETEPIPTVSEWGLVAITLLLLVAGTLVYARPWSRSP